MNCIGNFQIWCPSRTILLYFMNQKLAELVSDQQNVKYINQLLQTKKNKLLLNRVIQNLKLDWNSVKTKAEVGDIVDKVTSSISKCAIDSELPRNKQSKSNLDFWAPQLDRLKSAMRTAIDEYNKYLKVNNVE